MNRELIAVIDEIGRQKGIDKARVIGAIESALQTAAKKRFGQAENIQVEIDGKTGEAVPLGACRYPNYPARGMPRVRAQVRKSSAVHWLRSRWMFRSKAQRLRAPAPSGRLRCASRKSG